MNERERAIQADAADAAARLDTAAAALRFVPPPYPSDVPALDVASWRLAVLCAAQAMTDAAAEARRTPTGPGDAVARFRVAADDARDAVALLCRLASDVPFDGEAAPILRTAQSTAARAVRELRTAADAMHRPAPAPASTLDDDDDGAPTFDAEAQGRAAAQAGRPFDACPYPDDTRARDVWALGWDLERHRMKGQAAAVAGRALEECPHPAGTPERDAWCEGWQRAPRVAT